VSTIPPRGLPDTWVLLLILKVQSSQNFFALNNLNTKRNK